MSENKLYRIKMKEGAHVNEKLKKDGSRAAIQFDDNNVLQGPVDLIEVDESEYIREIYFERQERSFGQAIVEDAVVPAVQEAVTEILFRATKASINATRNWMSETFLPAVKTKGKKLVNMAVELYEAKKAKKAVKKSATVAIKQKTEVKVSTLRIENRTVIHTQAEVDQILNNMKYAALYIAAGISELSNTAIADNGTDPERTLAIQKKLKELSSGEVLNTIEFMLEDENRDILDQATIRLFETFRQNEFIMEGETVPISRYLEEIVEE